MLGGALALAVAGGFLGTRAPAYRAEAVIEVSPAAGSQIPRYQAAASVRSVLLSDTTAAAAAAAAAGLDPVEAGRRVVAEPAGDGGSVAVWWQSPSAEEAERLASGGLGLALPLARMTIGEGARVETADPAPRARPVDRPAGLSAAAVAGLGLIGAGLGAVGAEVAARRRRP